MSLEDIIKKTTDVMDKKQEREDERHLELIGWLDTLNDNLSEVNMNLEKMIKGIKNVEDELYQNRNQK